MYGSTSQDRFGSLRCHSPHRSPSFTIRIPSFLSLHSSIENLLPPVPVSCARGAQDSVIILPTGYPRSGHCLFFAFSETARYNLFDRPGLGLWPVRVEWESENVHTLVFGFWEAGEMTDTLTVPDGVGKSIQRAFFCNIRMAFEGT